MVHPAPDRRWLSALLALAVHGLFVWLMLFALRWQSTPAPVVAELWDAIPAPQTVLPPPAPPPKAEPELPEPKPKPPAPPPPKPDVKPPEPPKPDIALEQEKRRQELKRLEEEKRKAEQKRVEEEKRLAEKKRQDELAEKKLQEDQGRQEEQRRLEEQQRAEQAARDAAIRQAADQARQAEVQQARARALDIYIAQLTRAVRARIVLPPSVQGNPEAELRVVQLPTGEVVSVRLLRSSGDAALDQAVERAVFAASPLPLPADRSLFKREFSFTFRPFE